jgi:GNAT superfamily N-acetyltransferase
MSFSWQNRYFPRHEPGHTLRKMTPADIPGAVALAHSFGWGHGPADWERLLDWSPEGCFVIEEEGRGIIGTTTTTPYGTALAWIGMVLVAQDRQRRGLGQQLMRAAMDYLIACDVARIMLDASDAGRPLYDKLGFRMLYKVERWEGRASTYLGARARALRPDDTAAVLAMDTECFGVPREHIPTRLISEFPELAWVDYDHNQLTGYLLGRRMAGQVYLGPWVSWSAASAERLLRIALERLQGEDVVLNIPDTNGRALILASDHNLRRQRHCMRMIYGDTEPVEGDPLAQLAVATLATG